MMRYDLLLVSCTLLLYHIYMSKDIKIFKKSDEEAGKVNPKTQEKITSVCNAMRDLLLEKNKRYGDAALNPLNIFSPLQSAGSIKVRLDDKLKRIKNRKSDDPSVNDVCDIIGYCFLLLISMGVTQEQILKLID